MDEEEAREALTTLELEIRLKGQKLDDNQVGIWLQQIRMRGKGYFMQPEALKFLEELKREYEV